MASPTLSRKVYLDLLRIFAIMLVIVNHTVLFSYPFQQPACLKTYIWLHFSIFIKIAVPLFLMVTGALLLPREEEIVVILKKRVFRFFVILAAFTIIQKVYSGLMVLKAPYTFKDFFITCLHANGKSYVEWFLFAYLAIMLLLPFLRILVKNMEAKHFYYLFALQIIFTGFLPFNGSIQKWLILSNYQAGQNVFIFLFAGYYLENRFDEKSLSPRNIKGLILLSFLSVMLGALMCEVGRRCGHLSAYPHYIPCMQGCVLIPCMTIYILLKRGVRSLVLRERTVRLIATLSGAVFSLMLVENILRWSALRITAHLSKSLFIATLLSLPIVYIVGFAFGVVMKKIPGIKKFV